MNIIENLDILKPDYILAEKLLECPAKFEIVTGNSGLKNKILNKQLYRPQLALAGYLGFFNFKQIQIFGNTEVFYLQSLPLQKRIDSFNDLTQFPIPCIILTNSHVLDKELIDIAISNNIAIYSTNLDTSHATYLITDFLDDQFAPQASIHGSFVDVYGVGVLFTGKSGIGKSEIALDLVERGHRLVADDVVLLFKKNERVIMGTGTDLVQHFMEIRGLGILDIRQMFGIRSIRFQKRLEIVVELQEWNPEEEYTRIGLDEEPIDIMGAEISRVKLPIFPGKNITVISEVIAINYLLRTYGYNAAQVFSDKLQKELSKKAGNKPGFYDRRMVNWFQGDHE